MLYTYIYTYNSNLLAHVYVEEMAFDVLQRLAAKCRTVVCVCVYIYVGIYLFVCMYIHTHTCDTYMLCTYIYTDKSHAHTCTNVGKIVCDVLERLAATRPAVVCV